LTCIETVLARLPSLGSALDTWPRSVVTLALGRIFVYIHPGELSPYSLPHIEEQLGRAMSEMDATGRAMDSLGCLGALASAFIFYHFMFSRGELIFLGTGPGLSRD